MLVLLHKATSLGDSASCPCSSQREEKVSAFKRHVVLDILVRAGSVDPSLPAHGQPTPGHKTLARIDHPSVLALETRDWEEAANSKGREKRPEGWFTHQQVSAILA